MKYCSVILLLSITVHFPPYNDAYDKCVYISQARQKVLTNPVKCATSTICRQNIKIANLTLPPYDQLLDIGNIIQKCCRPCMNYSAINQTVYDYKDVIKDISVIMKNSDFIFPFLATHDATTLYGWNFIPVKKGPSLFLITREHGNVLEKLIVSTLELYPLVIICLSLALIAGFIIWLLETWFNEEEFPRSFIVGWADGFWWSFISMTTVGYGDKTPRGHVARIFSVIWIIMGIAFFGIVTSEITSKLVQANNPPTPKVRGRETGILDYRMYDKSFVAMNGGVLLERKNKTTIKKMTGNFEKDIHTLITELKSEKVKGIVLDKGTLQHALHVFKHEKNSTAEHKALYTFFVNKTVRTEIPYTGEVMSYGILVKDKKHYDFFRPAILDNRLQWNNVNELKRNTKELSSTEKKLLFNPRGHYFITSMIGIFTIIGAIILFGLVYETRRRRKDAKNGKSVGSADNPSLQYELKPQE